MFKRGYRKVYQRRAPSRRLARSSKPVYRRTAPTYGPRRRSYRYSAYRPRATYRPTRRRFTYSARRYY